MTTTSRSLKDMTAEAYEIAAGRLERGQELPHTFDVTAELLASALIETCKSIDLGELSAEGLIVAAIADLLNGAAA